MRVGVTMLVQNNADWDRFEAQERGEDVPGGAAFEDSERFGEDLRLHEQIEDLGYDSLWTVEHHFTPYAMVTNPIQLLTYFAGRTKRIDLGTMVVVLPWHNPLRVAEDMLMLQNFLGPDRNAIIGLGRGLGRREFGGLGIPQDTARARFVEGVEIIKQALTQDRFSFDGEVFQIPETSLRPRGGELGRKLVENLRGAWGSESSIPFVARAGLKPIIVTAKPWEEFAKDLGVFADAQREAGITPVPAIANLNIYCAETEEEARETFAKEAGAYSDSVIRHYELTSDHFKDLPSYSQYAERAAAVKALSPEVRREGYVRSHVCGTPDQCFERLQKLQEFLGISEFTLTFKYGDMPYETADRSLKLFAEKVLPRLHEIEVPEPAVAA